MKINQRSGHSTIKQYNLHDHTNDLTLIGSLISYTVRLPDHRVSKLN